MLNANLENKRVCIFCPSFFNYDIEIKKEVESLGAIVSLYDERVFTNVLGKALIRFNFRFLINYFIDKFYTKYLLQNIKKIDYVLLINPETVKPTFLFRAKEINPNVKIITYMWDSFKNKKTSNEYITASDSFFTFDPDDAKKYNVDFLPLFFINDYKNVKNHNKFKYKFTFIGTAHSQRFNIVKNLTKNSSSNFLFFYCPSRLVYLYKKFVKRELNGLKISDVAFCSMKRRNIIDVIENSSTVIDISHPSQVGLTMRSIEMLGARKKILTTNGEILSYDFYHPNNILCIDDKITLCQINKFISLPYNNIRDDIYYSYCINSWIRKLFI